jgi:ParB/RepB/Spo0J family partition protein
MWWNVPEAQDGQPAEPRPKLPAVAGTVARRERTVLTLVPLGALEPNPAQPRKHFDDEKLGELASSIKARGLLQPIVVRRLGDRFQIVAGERRYRAAKLAGMDRVPALVRDTDDPLELALIENLQREDLTPLEEAEALAGLIDRHSYSHREVGELIGKSRPYVSNALALLRLPDNVKEELHRDGQAVSRELLMGVARCESSEEAEALWKRLRLDLMSVRRFRAEREGDPIVPRTIAREVSLAARRLNRALRKLRTAGVGDDERLALAKVLRRSDRLIQRQLRAMAETQAER